MRAGQSRDDPEFKGKGQALRLRIQQELGGGPLSIFGEAAQKHDLAIREVTAGVLTKLAEEFPNLESGNEIPSPKEKSTKSYEASILGLGKRCMLKAPAYDRMVALRKSWTGMVTGGLFWWANQNTKEMTLRTFLLAFCRGRTKIKISWLQETLSSVCIRTC